MKIKLFTIPNILTLCNLLSGCAAAVFALCVNDLQWAFWCVVVAAGFDFLDGFVARLLKSHSAIGKELDSLADMVSFGFAPAAVLYTMYAMTGGSDVWGFAVFVVAAFSALRLAKFNLDENQTTQFIGLPLVFRVGRLSDAGGGFYGSGLGDDRRRSRFCGSAGMQRADVRP